MDELIQNILNYKKPGRNRTLCYYFEKEDNYGNQEIYAVVKADKTDVRSESYEVIYIAFSDEADDDDENKEPYSNVYLRTE